MTIMRYTLQEGVAGAQPPGGHEGQDNWRKIQMIVDFIQYITKLITIRKDDHYGMEF